MPRPRFQRLDSAQRKAILSVATEEFAEHGFEGASYNRIIERSGLSKGAMYYYFDDKEDLFVTALSDALERIVVAVGSVSEAATPDAFWREVTAWCHRSLELAQADPAAMGLMRTLLKGAERGSTSGALAELRRVGRQHMAEFIARGQSVGAIRTDLADGLLVSVMMSLEEGIDRWLLDKVADFEAADLDRISRTMTLLYRRLAEPDPPVAQAQKRNGRTKKRRASR